MPLVIDHFLTAAEVQRTAAALLDLVDALERLAVKRSAPPQGLRRPGRALP